VEGKEREGVRTLIGHEEGNLLDGSTSSRTLKYSAVETKKGHTKPKRPKETDEKGQDIS
jgi:hypothetical protein